MSVSTNSIIHYTNKFENLLGIISEGFKVKYCSKLMLSHKWKINNQVPMISFCDIPFSSFQEDILKFMEVMASDCRKTGPIKRELIQCFTWQSVHRLIIYILIKWQKQLLKKADIKTLDFMQKLIVNTKNYQSDLERGKIKIKDYRFYNEREWR